MNTCGDCRWFRRYGTEQRGECCTNPPVAMPSGYCKRPEVSTNTPGCRHYGPVSAMTNEAQAADPIPPKVKVNPETPGHAAKAARKERR